LPRPLAWPFEALAEGGEGVPRRHWTKINNGVLEGINSLVPPAKRRARESHNKRGLIAMIHLIAGRLDFSPMGTSEALLPPRLPRGL
jgi:hypothetical protein